MPNYTLSSDITVVNKLSTGTQNKANETPRFRKPIRIQYYVTRELSTSVDDPPLLSVPISSSENILVPRIFCSPPSALVTHRLLENFRETETKSWIKKHVTDNCILILKHCDRTMFPLQNSPSSSRCIFFWSFWRSGFNKLGTNETFPSRYWENKNDQTGQHFGNTRPKSNSPEASKKNRHAARW